MAGVIVIYPLIAMIFVVTVNMSMLNEEKFVKIVGIFRNHIHHCELWCNSLAGILSLQKPIIFATVLSLLNVA